MGDIVIRVGRTDRVQQPGRPHDSACRKIWISSRFQAASGSKSWGSGVNAGSVRVEVSSYRFGVLRGSEVNRLFSA